MYKTCPNWLKEAYRRAVKFTCEQCGKSEQIVGKLEVHRIVRGNKGGKYNPSNCKIDCKECHKKYHYKELY